MGTSVLGDQSNVVPQSNPMSLTQSKHTTHPGVFPALQERLGSSKPCPWAEHCSWAVEQDGQAGIRQGRSY